MVNIRTITSANSIFLLTIPGLFNQPVQIAGFTSDTAFTTDAIAPTEASMGIDGFLSAGMVLNPIKQKISLMPDSDSITLFDTWFQTQNSSRQVFYAYGTLVIPGLIKVYVFGKGVLTNAKTIPDAKKTMQAQDYEITWETVTCGGM